MAYCTVEEVFAMFKEDALNTLAGTDYIEDPELSLIHISEPTRH